MPTRDDREAAAVPSPGRRRTVIDLRANPPAIKRLSVNLEAALHTRFKTACSATNRKMMAEMVAFVERRTEELEAEAEARKQFAGAGSRREFTDGAN